MSIETKPVTGHGKLIEASMREDHSLFGKTMKCLNSLWARNHARKWERYFEQKQKDVQANASE